MTSIRIGKIILSALKSDERLCSIVNGNIFPLVVKDGVTGPFVVYRRTGLYTERNKDFYSSRVTVEIACVANDYSTSVDMADIVSSLITRKNISCANSINIDSVLEEYTDDAYVQTLTFTLAIIEDIKN